MTGHTVLADAVLFAAP